MNRYALVDATNIVVNVILIDVPVGGTLHHSSDGQHWMLGPDGQYHGSYRTEPNHELIAVPDDVFVEPELLRLPDGSFAK